MVFSRKSAPAATSAMSRTTKVSTMKSTHKIEASETYDTATKNDGANKRKVQRASCVNDSVKQTETAITATGFI
jgi:hypothetical protein